MFAFAVIVCCHALISFSSTHGSELAFLNWMSIFLQARLPHLQIPTGKQEDAPEKIDNSKVKL